MMLNRRILPNVIAYMRKGHGYLQSVLFAQADLLLIRFRSNLLGSGDAQMHIGRGGLIALGVRYGEMSVNPNNTGFFAGIVAPDSDEISGCLSHKRRRKR